MKTHLRNMSIPAPYVKDGDLIHLSGEGWHPVTLVRPSKSGKGLYLDTVPKPQGESTFVYHTEEVQVRRPVREFEDSDVLWILINRYARHTVTDEDEREERTNVWTEKVAEFIETTVNGPQH